MRKQGRKPPPSEMEILFDDIDPASYSALCSAFEEKDAMIPSATALPNSKRKSPAALLWERFWSSFFPIDKLSPLEFATKEVDFSEIPGSPAARLDLDLIPFIKAPLAGFDFHTVREITFCAIEQTCKTLFWMLGLAWAIKYRPGLSLIIYPNDQLCERTDDEKFRPLLKGVAEIRRELQRTYAIGEMCYRFPSFGSTVYYCSAGSRITSLSVPLAIIDETDDVHRVKAKPSVVTDARNRLRAFTLPGMGGALLVKVCTPRFEEYDQWQEFLESSQGYWTLRCLSPDCKELTMRSCDIDNLQWDKELIKGEDGTELIRIIPESIRLVCPKCGREHVESEKREMIISGDYVFRIPSLIGIHDGYQVGALASQQGAHAWLKIAEAREKAGRTGDLKDQRHFDNSVRGLPLQMRKTSDESAEVLLNRKKVDIPDGSKFVLRIWGIDTQDNNMLYAVCRGYLVNGDSWPLLALCAKVDDPSAKGKDFDILFSAISGRASRVDAGLPPLPVTSHAVRPANIVVIDEGGHRLKEVNAFVAKLRAFKIPVIKYKGDSRAAQGGHTFKPSENDPHLILADALYYQAVLLHNIYSRKPQAGHNWYANPEMQEEYFTHLAALKPNSKRRSGHQYRNWVNDGPDHFFDCEKEIILARDYLAALEIVKRKRAAETREAPRKQLNYP